MTIRIDASVAEHGMDDLAVALFGGERRHQVALPRLNVVYAWLPPFEGASRTAPNRLEVVFSRHPRVVIEQAGTTHELDVESGGLYIVGAEPTTLLSVPEYSDTLEIYPDAEFLRAIAAELGVEGYELRPTLDGETRPFIAADREILGLAYLLRQVCLGQRCVSAIEASSLEHLLVAHLVGHRASARGSGRLTPAALKRVLDRVEDQLDDALTIDDLAGEACLSTFHFARAFKRSTGMAPHAYVLSRRVECARQKIMTSDAPISEIAAGLGFENLHHFRRQFRSQLGVLPGTFRAMIT